MAYILFTTAAILFAFHARFYLHRRKRTQVRRPVGRRHRSGRGAGVRFYVPGHPVDRRLRARGAGQARADRQHENGHGDGGGAPDESDPDGSERHGGRVGVPVRRPARVAGPGRRRPHVRGHAAGRRLQPVRADGRTRFVRRADRSVLHDSSTVLFRGDGGDGFYEMSLAFRLDGQRDRTKTIQTHTLSNNSSAEETHLLVVMELKFLPVGPFL